MYSGKDRLLMWELQNSAKKCLVTVLFSQPVTLSLAVAVTSIIFIATNTCLCVSRQTRVLSRQACFCRDKHLFVATKDVFCLGKSILVTTNVLPRQKYFVATNILLSRQNLCRSKHTFVATKLDILTDNNG